jgi:hypothetical protein
MKEPRLLMMRGVASSSTHAVGCCVQPSPALLFYFLRHCQSYEPGLIEIIFTLVHATLADRLRYEIDGFNCSAVIRRPAQYSPAVAFTKVTELRCHLHPPPSLSPPPPFAHLCVAVHPVVHIVCPSVTCLVGGRVGTLQ